MNKAELIDAVAASAELSKAQAERALDALFDQVRAAVKAGDKVAWPKFGSFGMSQTKARVGRNPRTGAAVKIAAAKKIRFAASASLKEFLNTKGAVKKAAAPAKKAAAPAKKAAAPVKKAAAPAKKAAAPAKKAAAPAKKAAAPVKKAAAPAKKAAAPVKKAAKR